MTLKPFLQRYVSFTLAKVALVVGRWLILILALQWLAPSEFARVAGALSLVEILRAFGDMGAENIIYARLAPAWQPVPRIVKTLVRLRVTVASLLGLVAAAMFGMLAEHGAWVLFFLVPVLAFQNASVAFLQKHRNFKQMLILVLAAAAVAGVSAAAAWLAEPAGLVLCLLLLLPEAVAAAVGVILTRKHWVLVLASGQRSARRSLPRLWPFLGPSAAVGVLVMGYSRLDVLLVLPLFGLLAQAQYSAGFRLVEPVFLLLSLASISLLAELGAVDTRLARSAAGRMMDWMNIPVLFGLLFLACALGWGMEVLATHLLQLPPQAAQVAGFLALAIPVKLLNTFLTTLLQRGGRYDRVLSAALLNAAVTWSMALLLGIVLGVAGVALGALMGEILNFFFQRQVVREMLMKGGV